MTNSIPGIYVHSNVSIDHLELGKQFAKWDNEDQALFLFGMSLGLEGMDPMQRGTQIMYLTEFASRTGIDEEIRKMLNFIIEYLAES